MVHDANLDEGAGASRPASRAGAPTSCNSCHGPTRVRYDRVVDPQTHETFGIAACTTCGLGETFPQPADLGRYYGAEYHGGRHGFTATYCVQRRMRFLKQVAGAPAGRSLLDVGCGDGTFLVSAQEHGWRVAGTEMNPSIARSEGLKIWEALDEASAQAPYDCVTLWHSLEHMRNPRATIEQATALLKPGGTMFVAVPNAEGLQASLFGPKWFHLDVPRHLFHFGTKSLSRMLETAGLSITRTFHLEVELDLFGWTQSALNSIFPEPNLFFHQLTGKPTHAGAVTKSANFVAGSVLTALATPLTAVAPLGKNGAILVMAARKPLG
jgi:SAM-dependent methyltransferase